MTVPNGASLDQLNDMLWRGDPVTAAAAADKLSDIKQTAIEGGTVPDWRITVYDKFWSIIGIVGDYMECTGMDPRNKVPTAQLKVKGDDPIVPIFMNCQKTMVGVTIETEGLRFPFYVDTFDYVFDKGQWTGTANLLGIWDILNYLQVWPDFFAPIQAQIPFSHAILLGPLISSIEIMIMEQALRIQTGLWEFINNALSLNIDFRAWFGTLLEYNGNIFEMLQAPIVVTLTNPLLDTSMLVCRTIRMETCGAVIKDITRATGIDVRVDLWLPGDPQPENLWIELLLPAYVITVTDRSQITGPTGTILDSIIKTIVDLTGSIMGDIVAPLILGYQEVRGLPQGFFISPALGVNWVPPWVLLIAPEPGQPGSVETCKITSHTPKGWQHIIGGRSPQWVGAPPGDWGGTGPLRQTLTKRHHQPLLRMDNRRPIHPHRLLRHPKRHDGRIPQQRLPRIPTLGILRTPPRRRPLPPRRRSIPRHRISPIQHRNHLRLHQRILGQPRLDVRASHLPKRRSLHPRKRHIPRPTHLHRLPRPHPALHRLFGTSVLAHRPKNP